ncbi:MAG: Mu transposase C-terminal domain-containing protein, partial [Syntrophomonas sp.]|nr:Mu transposase C-terminal domain-containing protein [Syntrophomonas sp.]
IHAPIRDGAAKAKVERSFRTIKDTWLNGFDPSEVSSLQDLNRLLADYVRMRNNSVNRNTGETPMERYSKHIDRIRFSKSREWLDECFMNRIIRKVNNDSTVSIDSVMYDVPMQFIRSKIEIRYLPDDMKNAYILHQGKSYPIRRTNKLENSRTKREKLPAIDYSLNGGLLQATAWLLVEEYVLICFCHNYLNAGQAKCLAEFYEKRLSTGTAAAVPLFVKI